MVPSPTFGVGLKTLRQAPASHDIHGSRLFRKIVGLCFILKRETVSVFSVSAGKPSSCGHECHFLKLKFCYALADAHPDDVASPACGRPTIKTKVVQHKRHPLSRPRSRLLLL